MYMYVRVCVFVCVRACVCVCVCDENGACSVTQHLYGSDLIFELLFVDNLESPGIYKCQQVFLVTHSNSVPIRTPSYINIFPSCRHCVCTLTGWKERDEIYYANRLTKNILMTIN